MYGRKRTPNIFYGCRLSDKRYVYKVLGASMSECVMCLCVCAWVRAARGREGVVFGSSM